MGREAPGGSQLMNERPKLRRRVSVPVAVMVIGIQLIAVTLLYRKLVSRQQAHEYPSQLQQDRWVLETVFPGVKDGYFVDVGSGDGEYISNTWRLETNGWKGVCIDPFPTNMARRSCQMFREVVYSTSGRTVTFRDGALFGGIDALIPSSTRGLVASSRTVEFKTVTLDDVLARAKAPRFIHYVSVDVEGAELEVLKGLSLDRYQVGAFTIEHNFQEPKRTEIRSLLEKSGYRLAKSVQWEDWYLPGKAVPQTAEAPPR
jgi:FkbM family methyltransferase